MAAVVALITGNTVAVPMLVAGTVALWLVATTTRVVAGVRGRVGDRDLRRLIDVEDRKQHR